jgi:cytochrome P450
MLLEARDEAGEPMGDQELRDQMYTLLMAGHETTATSLAWAIYHVLTRPDVLERIRAELADVVGGGPIEPSHVGRLPYIDAVIKETARLTPVITDTGRLLRVPMRLGDRDLPAGVIAMASIYLAHRRPDLWTDPDRFDPDRFLDSRTSPYVFLPFGGGERRCIGAAFANYEMKIVLAQLLSRVDLRLRDGYRPRPLKRAVTVGPSGGVPVSLTRRTPS